MTSHDEPSRYESFSNMQPPSQNASGFAERTAALLQSTFSRTAGGDEDEQWTSLQFLALNIGLAGAQFTWTVELGAGTPYLLSLGLSKQLTSLVWLAGPLSGLIVQPLIGAITDASSSRFRRRKFIVGSTVIILCSTAVLAFALGIASFFVNLFSGDLGDWDPARQKSIQNATILLAVFAFYVLDFSLNALQACLRALILDMVPANQQTTANAWQSRCGQFGSVLGFGVGFLPLNKVFWFLGGGQFRKLCFISMIWLFLTVSVTCLTQNEARSKKQPDRKGIKAALRGVYQAVFTLPVPIRRVCYYQLLSWQSWFPVLFYSTTYVGDIWMDQHPSHGHHDRDEATRIGTFAMLLQALIAASAGTLLPMLPDAGKSEWVLNKGPRWMRFLLSKCYPRNILTASHVLFVIIIATTWSIHTSEGATAAIAALGVSWAVTCWIPFALVMEFIRDVEDTGSCVPQDTISSSKYHSERDNANRAISECTPLKGYSENDNNTGGTILGVHNIAIVVPQFIVAILASIIFKITEAADNSPDTVSAQNSSDGVAWVLRFGGIAAALAAIGSRFIPQPYSEIEYIRNLDDANEGIFERISSREEY